MAMPRAQERRTRDLGILALATVGPVWGYSWVVTKVGLGYANPFTFIALITTLCAASLFVVLIVTKRPLKPPPLGWTLAIALTQNALFNSLCTIAVDLGGAGKVSVLVYTGPFWLLLLAWGFLGERLRGPQWPAVALAFTGLVLVVRPWDSGSALSGVLACAAGFAWAAGSLLTKLLQRRTEVDALSLTAWQMTFAAVPLIGIALLTGSGPPEWTTTFVLCLAYSVLLANALCWALWVFALRALPAGTAGLGTLAVPVIGAAAAWIQLGEQPAAVEAAGMALIVASLALLAAFGVRTARGAGRVGGAADAAPPVID